MLRRLMMAGTAFFFVMVLGCNEPVSKDTNPDNLEFNKDGPPKREGVKGMKKG